MFNAKELDEETGLYYYGARYLDPRVSQFLSADRFAEKYPFSSAYSYCLGNPVKFIDFHGDSIFVNKIGTILRNDKTDNLVYMSKDGKNIFLGELGGKINIDEIYTNLLDEDSKDAKSIWSPFRFREKVKTDGVWDLKNDKNTIYGLGNDGKTTFSFQGKNMESQDIGNHHFGVVAKAYNFFDEETILRQAGKYQIESGTSKPEWQIYKEESHTLVSPTGGIIFTKINVMQPPYGDDPRDQMWIKSGFDYYKEKKK